MGMIEEQGNNFQLCSKEKLHVSLEEIEIPEDNTKMMNSYPSSLKNMMSLYEIKPRFQHCRSKTNITDRVFKLFLTM